MIQKGEMGLFIEVIPLLYVTCIRDGFSFPSDGDLFPDTIADPHLCQQKVAERRTCLWLPVTLRKWDSVFERRHLSHPSLKPLGCKAENHGERVAWWLLMVGPFSQ